MSTFPYAHTLPDKPEKEWEPLFTPFGSGEDQCRKAGCPKCRDLDQRHGHLNKVAWWTARHAAAMFPPGSKEAETAWQWGWLAGIWHDLGKFAEKFQKKLMGERIQVEHTGAGALLAQELGGTYWETLAFVIAGHHAGLCNRAAKVESDVLTPLDERVKRAKEALLECRNEFVKFFGQDALLLVPPGPLTIPFWGAATDPDAFVRWTVFTRMLFSALVDADSLATERFCSPGDPLTALRMTPSYDSIDTIRRNVDSHLDRLQETAADTEVNHLRRAILNWCREAAVQSPGFFTLNVPTGGGKTLASMSFALRHIVANLAKGMRRVIVAVPYTSIIEQNASVYAKALGAHNVIEHHSNLDDFNDREEADETTVRRRLACENWDAPVIVTTNVQLFESLFAHKRRRARKLHNIAGSVIILDEAQCVPIGYMALIVPALRELVECYNCTVVISTATQPSWKKRKCLPFGLPEEWLRPIIPLNVGLPWKAAFDRVEIEWPKDCNPTSYEELAVQLVDETCVLAVVHRKKDAQWLANRLRELCPGDPVFHLSTNMCPVHRRTVLVSIRGALEEHREKGRSCRIVSTQLIEAGVDLDVSSVWKVISGLDSIAQAAGRCNREGLLGKGRVVVFHSETEPPDGHLKHCAEATKLVLEEFGGSVDLRDPAVFERFFVQLYLTQKADAKDLVRHVTGMNFETLGREFRLIENDQQTPVVIAYDEEAHARLRTIRGIAQGTAGAEVAARVAFRALQPYTVSVWKKGLETLRPALEPLFPGADGEGWVLNTTLFPNSYDEVFGLVVDDEPVIPPSVLVF